MKSSLPEFVAVGRILAPWGVKGKLKAEVLTDFPQRFAPGTTVYIDQQPLTVESTEWRRDRVIIKLPTIDSIDAAEKFRGKLIEIPHSQITPLQEGQYYCFQLIGLAVWTTRGEFLGNITEILTASSNDSYVVSGARGEILIPAIDDVIKSIDLAQGRMTIEAIKGLLD